MRAANDVLPALYLSDDPDEVIAVAAAVEGLSSGALAHPETFNRRTGKPERGGLYCAKLFGPVRDHQCLCGKLASVEHAGQRCDKCGVLCGDSRIRGERWAHIVLDAPLVHPVLARKIARTLGCSLAELTSVIKYEADFDADGDVVAGDLEVDGDCRGVHQVAARLGDHAARLLLRHVPVTPPTWRGTRKDPQDIAYAALLNRANRLRRLLELNAPEIILRNECYMAQQAFDRLYTVARAELRIRGPVVVAPDSARARALLAAVYDDPDSDAARRAYADHLSEHGDPRGAFIRRQLASTARTRLVEDDALRRNYDRWTAPLAGAVADNVRFRRGFPARCKTTPGAADRIGDPAWSTIEQLDTDIAALVVDPGMRSLVNLGVPWATLVAVCTADVELPRIHTLWLTLGRSPPPQHERVADTTAFPGLRTLVLAQRSKKPPDWTWLRSAALLHPVERLTVHLPLDRIADLSLPWWLEFMAAHPQLSVLAITLQKCLTFELHRDRGWTDLRVHVSRIVVERVSLGYAELARQIGDVLTALAPHDVLSVRVGGGSSWYGEDLVALAQRLQDHFHANLTLPRFY